MYPVLGLIFQLVVMLLLAPLVNGIIKKVKALTQKRKGAPLLQTYLDLYKLFTKETVFSDKASWISRAAPWIIFGAVVCAAAFIPISSQLPVPAFTGDAVLVIYTLALGRFFLALGGLDAGSTFGGMGSSREMMISALVEPALLVSVFTVGLLAKTSSVAGMVRHAEAMGSGVLQPVYILTFLALFIILLSETARIPVDDPATHLELTMVHEAMLLEQSGRYLGLLEWASVVKQLILLTLLANLFIPVTLTGLAGGGAVTLLLSLLVYVLKIAGLALLVGAVETMTVKLRLFSVPNLAALAFIAAFLGFLQTFVFGGGV